MCQMQFLFLKSTFLKFSFNFLIFFPAYNNNKVKLSRQEKVTEKCGCSVPQSYLTLCSPLDCSPTPLPLEFSRQEYWSREPLPLPTPGDLPDPGIKLMSPASPALAGGFWKYREVYLNFSNFVRLMTARF